MASKPVTGTDYEVITAIQLALEEDEKDCIATLMACGWNLTLVREPDRVALRLEQSDRSWML